LLASAGIIIGAVVAAVLAEDWRPSNLTCGTAWISWAGGLLTLVGVASLAYAVYAQTKRRKDTPQIVAYYADVNRFDRDDDLILALDRTASDPDSRNVDQVRAISQIVNVKYRCIRLALLAFVGATGLLIFATTTQ
jgi:hypothetical protein